MQLRISRIGKGSSFTTEKEVSKSGHNHIQKESRSNNPALICEMGAVKLPYGRNWTNSRLPSNIIDTPFFRHPTVTKKTPIIPTPRFCGCSDASIFRKSITWAGTPRPLFRQTHCSETPTFQQSPSSSQGQPFSKLHGFDNPPIRFYTFSCKFLLSKIRIHVGLLKEYTGVFHKELAYSTFHCKYH